MTRHLLHFCALTLLALFSAGAAHAFDESDLLPVDEAFALDARAGDPGSARFDFTIAEGYYLYRHRFSVQALDDSGAAGALEVPRGTPHHDEFFGDVETWRSAVSATLSGLDGGGRSALRGGLAHLRDLQGKAARIKEDLGASARKG